MLTTSRVILEAPQLWRHLNNGIINVYKPAGVSQRQVQTRIIANLCRDLNAMHVRPPRDMVKIEAAHDNSSFVVKTETNLADHVLVVGERYQQGDFKSAASCHLGKFTSGVMLLGINRGTKLAYKIRENRAVRVYHLTGRFGMSTESHFNDSPITLRASCDHVTLSKVNSFLASLQASHQKKMFEMCGVDIRSQAAFDLAAQGPLRPAVSNIPLVYSMRCIEFKKPYFTIEIHAVNESEAYLGILIHEIGIHMKTVAHCTQSRCIRQGHFTLQDALVRRHWNLETIMGNMARCNQLINDHPEMLEQLEATLKEQK